ncbi:MULTISPECIES: hypothetical protein [Desulfococcus]|jgi:hypothetical protein|uniref:Uncharacterized protein n=1 Tax=Desulfococcus multivorans DSM 2059 TaxID=1121405 RepID=S7U737_DESML|nr:hypothetical protein [Desulfococcus multivorans]AOY59141.1 uncharacterized protein Dmul_23690 [Desulfococcus multivorans]AQV01373.1 hypothetical protein B2D07_11820 [Desulfococcus multivorans]EPR44950.1 hypothetical protein dsmv_0986 [Desulfococcus multivorans DSM 2059]MDX9818570.1 hypothetical protein [Desulfococcus multivorans]SJZ84121.1 hypothetical protein SAMN02745446_01830 [Desulfococcus multivorans DSM 2059]
MNKFDLVKAYLIDMGMAIAYGDLATPEKTVDDEITTALESGKSSTAAADLLELKKKMGILQ